MWPEIKRKLFHLAALIYVVGIIYLPRWTYLAILGAALALVITGEAVRLRRPTVNRWLFERFGGLLRESERDRFSGVTWMLAGVIVTAAMVEPLPMAAAALLYLVLGDAAASLVGIRVRGPRWPRSPRRLSGTAACFVVCLIIGATLLPFEYGWHGVLAGAVAATILEAGVVPLSDNFTIPVGSGAALLAAYGLPPFAGLL